MFQVFQSYVNTLAKGLFQYILVMAFERCVLGLEISFVVFQIRCFYIQSVLYYQAIYIRLYSLIVCLEWIWM